jgi:uncharacterized integral membrane protein
LILYVFNLEKEKKKTSTVTLLTSRVLLFQGTGIIWSVMTKRTMMMIIIVIIVITSTMAVQINTTPFRMPQPLSMTFTQGILRAESTKAHVQVYRQIYYNSIMRGTSVQSRNTGINFKAFFANKCNLY